MSIATAPYFCSEVRKDIPMSKQTGGTVPIDQNTINTMHTSQATPKVLKELTSYLKTKNIHLFNRFITNGLH